MRGHARLWGRTRRDGERSLGAVHVAIGALDEDHRIAADDEVARVRLVGVGRRRKSLPHVALQ